MIERDIYTQIEPVLFAPEAIVITGMRRVGKTTLLRFIQEKLASSNTLFLDLENPVNQRYFEVENYEAILDNLKFLGLDPNQQGYVFLDEVQSVRVLPSVVKYLSDHYPIKFFLSGSSSFYLKNHFSESLAGRKYIFELYPLSFREFLRFKAPRLDMRNLSRQAVSQEIFGTLEPYYAEYLRYGGFPGVVLKTSVEEKSRMLEDIFSSYFRLEVVQLGEFRKTNAVRDLLLLLLERVGAKLDIQKLSRELGVARETVAKYLDFLEDTYFIHRIRPFSRNRDTELRSTPKAYLCDTGLITRLARVSDGALFENAVFSALRFSGKVHYFQKKSGVEIDFILDERAAYEVKLSADDHDVRRLGILAEGLKLSEAYIVSRKYCPIQGIRYGWQL